MPDPVPTLDRYLTGIRYDIQNGWPFTPDIHEPMNGQPRLQGHPLDQDIWHWFAVYGYDQSGNITAYADSATSVWSGVPATSNVSSSDVVTLIHDRGVVW